MDFLLNIFKGIAADFKIHASWVIIGVITIFVLSNYLHYKYIQEMATENYRMYKKEMDVLSSIESKIDNDYKEMVLSINNLYDIKSLIKDLRDDKYYEEWGNCTSPDVVNKLLYVQQKERTNRII